MTSRDASQYFGRIKRAADRGPVIITDRGEPAYVVLSYKEYRQRVREEPSIVEILNHPASAHLEFEPERLRDEWPERRDLD